MGADGSTRTPSRTDDLVWYVSYGSNMSSERLRHYLEGGRPAGATRTYDGARDPTPPRRRRGVQLGGTVYFARHSSVWDGGVAFYDPDTVGGAVGRAHLVTVGQFSDIAHQERGGESGSDLDLHQLLASGRSRIGSGWYDTLVLTGWSDDRPMITLTGSAGIAAASLNAPGEAYLRTIVAGLAEGHGWGPDRIGRYLAAVPGHPDGSDDG